MNTQNPMSAQPCANSAELAAAYDACRAIAKREAKNFYYAFKVLPAHKSDAMCAVYAFMRKADDLSDDESLSLDARRESMAAWTAQWRASRSADIVEDPVFLALRDTQTRFGISDSLLEQLVAGTTLDLQPQQAGTVSVTVAGAHPQVLQVYETFGALYRYCYLVASVVGLVCIRIFGYESSDAELYAEHTGIAFQLTNILRDIREDANRGRIYLPLDEMSATGVTVEELCSATRDQHAAPHTLGLLRREIGRAGAYYDASDKLIPLLHADSRAAMRVLVRIYRRLLERIEANPEAVFRTRVSVPTYEKILLLFIGLLETWKARLLR